MKVLRDEYGDDIPEEFLHESSARGGAADPKDLVRALMQILCLPKELNFTKNRFPALTPSLFLAA